MLWTAKFEVPLEVDALNDEAQAQLRSMLVYEPDQFFAPHQDSENNDEMIGALVVMLPSRCTGGARRRALQRVRAVLGSATSLTFVAF